MVRTAPSRPTPARPAAVEAETPPPARFLRDGLPEVGPPLLAALILAALWEGAIRLTNTPAYLVPAPTVIVTKAWANLPYFLGEGAYTLAEALAGLLVGSIVALSAATLMAHFCWIEKTLFPLAVASKSRRWSRLPRCS